MTLDITSDSHVHTPLCRHATGTMEEYVKAAIDKGLRRITFLEHLEEGIDYFERTWLTEDDFDQYFSEGSRLKDKYSGVIEIGLGVEVGYNPECTGRIIDRVSRRNWDCIGLSYHYCRIPQRVQQLNLLSKKQKNIELISTYGPGNLLSRYLEGLLDAVRTIPAQMLCHLDAGLRYQPELEYSDSHLLLVRELLESLKKCGMALEINTSGFVVRGEPFPRREIILQAQAMGIRLVASSDAHRPSEVGRYFDKLPALLASTPPA